MRCRRRDQFRAGVGAAIGNYGSFDVKETIAGAIVEGFSGDLAASARRHDAFYVCNGNQFGSERRYDPADPALLAEFRALLHVTARAAVAATR